MLAAVFRFFRLPIALWQCCLNDFILVNTMAQIKGSLKTQFSVAKWNSNGSSPPHRA
ncbi:hypothetical protein GCWU000324_02383 [Kingella oralis ATCC 51147]|uniref:Uncharacterized protein n=1 Tax=Kingella oralis ATCC 51147 TaxID=629741 RepID=C4GK09_9NEIS|nr:hypothetical protein GCWU000324_02383 [Kingella oralis ATCC 51147]